MVAAWVPRKTVLTVGALGDVEFARGWHAYVGSAQVARDARVARHLRADKPLRWHADYLFAVYPATRRWLLDTPLDECAVVERLIQRAGAARAVPGFGASDCGCGGHLLRLPAAPSRLAGLVG